jgi:hypothetical protein
MLGRGRAVKFSETIPHDQLADADIVRQVAERLHHRLVTAIACAHMDHDVTLTIRDGCTVVVEY